MAREGRSVSSLAVEAIVIVGSILLAFTIDAAWDGLQESRQRDELLASVLDEVRLNREELESVHVRNDSSLAQIDRFFRSTPEDLLALSPDDARATIRSLILVPDFTPVNEAAAALTSVSVRSPGEQAVKRGVAEWLRGVDLLMDVLGTANARAEAVDRLVSEHASENRSDGLSYLPSMVMRAGPEALLGIWSDDTLAASLIAKGTAQTVYGLVIEGRLENLRSLEESLVAVLGPRPAL